VIVHEHIGVNPTKKGLALPRWQPRFQLEFVKLIAFIEQSWRAVLCGCQRLRPPFVGKDGNRHLPYCRLRRCAVVDVWGHRCIGSHQGRVYWVQPGGLVEGSRWSFLLFRGMTTGANSRMNASRRDARTRVLLLNLQPARKSSIPPGCGSFHPHPVVVLSATSERPPATILHPSRMLPVLKGRGEGNPAIRGDYFHTCTGQNRPSAPTSRI